MSSASHQPTDARPATIGSGHAKPGSPGGAASARRGGKRSPGRSVPVRQCALIMPATGKRCGSIALRGQQFCRHHAENHLPFTGERDLCERLSRLSEQMNVMDIPQLLDFLRKKLVTMQKTLRRYPEVAHSLTYTLDRLESAKSSRSITSPLPQQNQKLTPQHQAILNQIRNLQARSLKSII